MMMRQKVAASYSTSQSLCRVNSVLHQVCMDVLPAVGKVTLQGFVLLTSAAVALGQTCKVTTVVLRYRSTNTELTHVKGCMSKRTCLGNLFIQCLPLW